MQIRTALIAFDEESEIKPDVAFTAPLAKLNVESESEKSKSKKEIEIKPGAAFTASPAKAGSSAMIICSDTTFLCQSSCVQLPLLFKK